MNLLAHAFLSSPAIEVRLGNVLADFIKGKDRKGLSEGLLEGIRQHQVIDAFTDSHAVVLRSKQRIREYGHLTGIIVDVAYDYFLSINWHRFSEVPLPLFISQTYSAFQTSGVILPNDAQTVLGWMIEEDWLTAYGSPEGMAETLEYTGRRLIERIGNDGGLSKAGESVLRHFDDFQNDFAEFFPALQEKTRW